VNSETYADFERIAPEASFEYAGEDGLDRPFERIAPGASFEYAGEDGLDRPCERGCQVHQACGRATQTNLVPSLRKKLPLMIDLVLEFSTSRSNLSFSFVYLDRRLHLKLEMNVIIDMLMAVWLISLIVIPSGVEIFSICLNRFLHKGQVFSCSDH
jgi:hypothetical protein